MDLTNPSDLDRAEHFALISRQLLSEPAERPVLSRIVHLAMETIPVCAGCGVSLSRAPDGVSPSTTSSMVEQAARLQHEVGEGPCLEAIETAEVCASGDLDHEVRWPRWSSHALRLGIRSCLSVPLEGATGVVGALNLYATTAHAFDSTDVAMATIFARHAADAIDTAQEVSGLRTALRSRQIIGVAQGILMQRFGLNLDQAFEVLRRYSQNENLKVREVAEELVRSGNLPVDHRRAPGGDPPVTATKARSAQ